MYIVCECVRVCVCVCVRACVRVCVSKFYSNFKISICICTLDSKFHIFDTKATNHILLLPIAPYPSSTRVANCPLSTYRPCLVCP